MHDFDYDCLQKKRIANGAFHKKSGIRSRRCTLPSDFLSPSELRRRNGPMKTYDMNKPMSWQEFLDMPDDLKATYIRCLRERFGATDVMFGQMFHVHATSFRTYRIAVGVDGKMPRAFGEHKLAREAAWRKFCKGEEPVDEEAPVLDAHTEPEEELCTEDTPKDPEPLIDPMRLADLTATFTGNFDPTSFLWWVTKLPMPDGRVRIRIEVTEA